MKRLLLLLTLIATTAIGMAQTVQPALTAKRVSATEKLMLRARGIDSISVDTSLSANANNVLSTQRALKAYIDKRANRDRPVFAQNGLTALNDSTLAILNYETYAGERRYLGWSNTGTWGLHTFPASSGPGGGGDSSFAIRMSYSDFDQSTGVPTDLLVFITDPYRFGLFRYTGDVADQTTDNTGTTIVTVDNKRWDRIYTGDILGTWFGITPDDATKDASNYAAWVKAFAARKTHQTLRLPGGGNWYFNNTLTSIQLNFAFKSSVVIEGNVRQTDPTKDGIWLEGHIPQYFKVTGTVDGANSGANDSLTYEAYTGTGIVIKNVYNSIIEVHEIQDFRNGIWMIGDGSGTQYTSVIGTGTGGAGKIHNNRTQILMTIGTSGPRWNNENNFFNFQLGAGTSAGPNGWYGVVITGASGTTSASSFESTDFWYIGFEGLRHGLVIDYGSSTNLYNSRFEGPAVAYKIKLNNSNAVHTKFFGGNPFADGFFVEGNRGAYTELIGGQLWGEVDARGTSSSSHTISTGSKTFTVNTGLTFAAGKAITMKFDEANYMTGTTTSYNTSTGELIVNVTAVTGSGTYAVWTINSNVGQGRLGEGLATIGGSPFQGVNNQPGKLVVFGTQYPGFTAMNSLTDRNNIIQMYKLAERPTTENGIVRIDTTTRWGAYKKTWNNITTQTSIYLKPNIGLITFNPSVGNVTAYLNAGDVLTSQYEDFWVEVVNNNYTLTIRNASSNTILLGPITYPSTGVWHYIYRNGSWFSYKDDGGVNTNPTTGGILNLSQMFGTGTALAAEIVGDSLRFHYATASTPGILSAGPQDIGGLKSFTANVTGGVARGMRIVPTLTAANNGSQLIGVDIDPTFNDNGFTGHVKYSVALSSILFKGTGLMNTSLNATANGLTWNETATPNPAAAATLYAMNIGSGSSSKDLMVLYSKTGVTSGGFGNNGTDLIFITEKTTNGFSWRKGVGFANASLTSGTEMMRLFSTGNLIVQNGGTFTDNGNRLQIAGRGSFTDQLYLGQLSTDPTTNLVNGAMYYNTTSNKFRGYENGAWVNMIGGGGGTGGGITSFGTPGTGNNNGGTVSTDGTQAILHFANATQPGIISTGSQTIPGLKTMAQTLTLRASTTAAGTTSLSFPAGSIPTVPENGKMFSNGTYLYFGALNAWQSLTTNSNVQTLTNKVWDGVEILPYKIDGYTTSVKRGQPVLTTNGTTSGTYWGENHGGYMVYNLTTNNVGGSDSGFGIFNLDANMLNNVTAAQIECILMGESISQPGKTFMRHVIDYVYKGNNGLLTYKGTQTVIKTQNDFSPQPWYNIGPGMLGDCDTYPGGCEYGVSVTSPAAGHTVQWTVYIKIRPVGDTAQ